MMTCGTGNDSCYVDATQDQVVELASGGPDTVYITADYTLAINVENMIINEVSALDGTGNALSNRLINNAADNVLTGLKGNDRLSAGLGNDVLIGGVGREVLTGGGGADDFVFAELGSTNYNPLVVFNVFEDTIQLSGAVFGLDQGVIDAPEFALDSNATTAAQRIIYEQANGDLYFDANGSGIGARQLIALLVDRTLLTYADIFGF